MTIPKNSRVIALGRAVTQLRSERRLTLAEIAREARLRPAYVEAVEAGEIVVTYTVLCRLADALSVAGHQLVALAEELPDDERVAP